MAATLSGWGRTAPTAATVVAIADEAAAADALAAAPPAGAVARGLGRSYGDASQNAGGIVLDCCGIVAPMALVDGGRLIRAGGGVTIEALLRALVPQGLFVPVTPGTRHVTVGGAIASDVHGKNHHVDGTFGRAVTELRLLTPARGTVVVSPSQEPDLFWATVGGMGLTGVILEATFLAKRVGSNRMTVTTSRANDLDEAMDQLVAGERGNDYTVAWIDLLARGRSLGRSVVDCGRHATAEEASSAGAIGVYAPSELVGVPPWVPSGLLNRATVKAFNELWFRKSPARPRTAVRSIDSFFYPLDAVRGWNRLYGRRGFLQHQCVVPHGAEGVLREIVEDFAASGAASFLAVLKRFGSANQGLLSFPLGGWTLAVDIPVAAPALAEALDAIDRKVVDAGGRLYLAKDSRMDPALLPEMYPELERWRAIRSEVDPEGLLQSDLGRRLGLVGAARADERP